MPSSSLRPAYIYLYMLDHDAKILRFVDDRILYYDVDISRFAPESVFSPLVHGVNG